MPDQRDTSPPINPGSPISSSVPIVSSSDSKKAKRRSNGLLHLSKVASCREKTKIGAVVATHRQAKATQLMPRPPVPRTSPMYRVSSWESHDSEVDGPFVKTGRVRKLSLAEALKESTHPAAAASVPVQSKLPSESLGERVRLFRLSGGSA